MQRIYEVMYIVRPDMADEDLEKLVSTIESNAKAAGANVSKVDRMGKRRLAYVVRKFKDGNYVLMTVEADGKAIHEVERRLRVSEPVIKFLTVRVDESQKRLDKVKKLRAQRVKRSTVEQQQAMQAQQQAAQQPAAEASAPAETPAQA